MDDDGICGGRDGEGGVAEVEGEVEGEGEGEGGVGKQGRGGQGIDGENWGGGWGDA